MQIIKIDDAKKIRQTIKGEDLKSPTENDSRVTGKAA